MSRRDAGFTLIELKVVIVVVALLYAVGAAFAVGVKRADRFSAAYTQDLSGLRKAVARVERDLRGAQTVEVGAGTATIDETVYRLEDARLLHWMHPISLVVIGLLVAWMLGAVFGGIRNYAAEAGLW